MSQNTKKLRKAFLNDFCTQLGIEKTDAKRSDAALVFIAYGETQSRRWLAQAVGDYANWERLVARRMVSRSAMRKKASSAKKRNTSRLKASATIVSLNRGISKRLIVGEGGAITSWERLGRDEERQILNRI